MNTADRDAVVKCLSDMLQLLEDDVISSLSFQNSVMSWKDAVQSLPCPVNGELSHVTVKAVFRDVDFKCQNLV